MLLIVLMNLDAHLEETVLADAHILTVVIPGGTGVMTLHLAQIMISNKDIIARRLAGVG